MASKISGHLRQAGYTDDQITLFAVQDRPKEGGLVVFLPGSSKTLKPLLLLGHIDVVAAKRDDWTRDPYKMVEENGYFYGRGAADMKAMDAIWIDTMIRFKRLGYHPKRTIKLALTCGEEGGSPFNGAEWLAKNRPALLDAEFALNEGGGGRTDGHGKLLTATMHVGEKSAQNYRIETTNPGGHSSAPVPDNAIYELADALVKVRGLEFPYPGVPLVPTMSTGATDGIFLEAIGIPSYGPPGLFGDPDGNGTHGLNEREAVRAVYTGRDLLTELVKVYADAD